MIPLSVHQARRCFVGVICAVLLFSASIPAQQVSTPAAPQQPETPAPADAAEHQHQPAGDGDLAHPTAREWGGSGTSWLPPSAPMYMFYTSTPRWQWMFHGSLYAQYLSDAGPRGYQQAGSINRVMAMGRRNVGAGRLTLRAMGSAEPWTIGGCGYPDLLASGEVCGREAIVDQQHPHDAVMELTVSYDRPLVSTVRWFVYAGPAGEPALGPVAFPHRPSAISNPVAPISHHWFDSSHITYGVITGGVFGERWKVESSAFNGREPDEHRGDLDLGRLDSVSGRLTFLPTASLALQVSAGHLKGAEAGHGADAGHDVNRVTASLIAQGRVGASGWWGATVAWARSGRPGGETQAVLGEMSIAVDDRQAWFGRAELTNKEAHDFGFHGPRQVFGVAKLQAGYTRFLTPVAGLQPGVGLSVTTGIVPEALRTVFGSRYNRGFGVFVTLRPSRHQM